jgi:methyl-accepting chemotaxis protein
MTAVPLFLEYYRKADRIMISLAWLMVLYALGLAFWHDTFIQAAAVGGGSTLVLTLLYRVIGGTRALRCCIAVVFMVLSALHINQTHGLIEAHFVIFVLLAALTFYRDWLPILVAAGVIIVHHLLFHALQEQGLPVYVMHHHAGWSMILAHAFYVVLETGILIYLAVRSRTEAVESQQTLDKLLGLRLEALGKHHPPPPPLRGSPQLGQSLR